MGIGEQFGNQFTLLKRERCRRISGEHLADIGLFLIFPKPKLLPLTNSIFPNLVSAVYKLSLITAINRDPQA